MPPVTACCTLRVILSYPRLPAQRPQSYSLRSSERRKIYARQGGRRLFFCCTTKCGCTSWIQYSSAMSGEHLLTHSHAHDFPPTHTHARLGRYICMYVHTRTRTCIRTHRPTHTHTRACSHAHASTRTLTRPRTHRLLGADCSMAADLNCWALRAPADVDSDGV